MKRICPSPRNGKPVLPRVAWPVRERKCGPVVAQQGKSARNVQHPERGNEGGYLEPRDDRTVGGTDHAACRQGNDDDEPCVKVDNDAKQVKRDPDIDQRPGDHAGQTEDRADGEIDAAGEDDEGHPDGEEPVDCNVLGHDHDVLKGQECLRKGREDHDDDQQRDHGPKLEQEQLDVHPCPSGHGVNPLHGSSPLFSSRRLNVSGPLLKPSQDRFRCTPRA